MRSSAPTTPTLNPCIFEFVYLARPDSVLDGISVYQARLNLGETLAKRVVSTVPPNEIDVIIPIPESSRPSATQLAHLLGMPYREGFVKNRYVGRTFIMPGQGVRKKSVRQKLNVIASEFKGRNVLLVDDSIVRGTTSREIVQMARDAGARKVYLASAAPPVRYPERLRHRHADQRRAGRARPHRRGDPRDHRLRRADLPGRRRHEARHRLRSTRSSTASMPRASTASTSPATSTPTTSRACSASRVIGRGRRGRHLAPGAAQSRGSLMTDEQTHCRRPAPRHAGRARRRASAASTARTPRRCT